MAWHLLVARRLPVVEAADRLVEWVYQTGQQTSKDVRDDVAHGTRKVEKWTRGVIQSLAKCPRQVNSIEKDRTHFSVAEVDAIRNLLGAKALDSSLLSVACSFLRFAKLHGEPQPTGWLVQIAVNGVIRKWPCCSGMKYKPLIEALKTAGVIELTRERRQTTNGTGRPRTYLIKVRPEFRAGAEMSQEQALRHASQSACTGEIECVTASRCEPSRNTYRMIYHPTSSEKMRKINEEVEQDRSHVERGSSTTSGRMNVLDYRQAETARLARLSTHDAVSTPTSPPTLTRSGVMARPSSGPLVQMVTTVDSPERENGPGEWRRRFRQQKSPRPALDNTPALTPLMSWDQSAVETTSQPHDPQRRQR